jgi:hypothetical protein
LIFKGREKQAAANAKSKIRVFIISTPPFLLFCD